MKNESQLNPTPPPPPPPENGATPAFDYDHFWLSHIKETLNGSREVLSKRLERYLIYLTSITLGVFITGLTYATLLKNAEWFDYLLIFVPIIILQLARLSVSLNASEPELRVIKDIRSPTQIHENFDAFITDLSSKASKARMFVSIAAVIFLITVPIEIFLFHKRGLTPKLPMQTPKHYLSVMKTAKVYHIEGKTDSLSRPKIFLISKNLTTKKDSTVVSQILTDPSGRFIEDITFSSFGLKDSTLRIEVKEDEAFKTYIFNQIKIK